MLDTQTRHEGALFDASRNWAGSPWEQLRQVSCMSGCGLLPSAPLSWA